MEKISIILLAIVCAGLVVYLMLLRRKIDELFDILTHTASSFNEFEKGDKKELSKIHSYVTDVDESLKKTRRRLKKAEEAIAELQKQQKEFEIIADESVRAQIDSEKAWAEGVRAIAGYGASIPTLNTKELDNE